MKTNMNEKMTSAEIGKLWAIYTGNSMSKCVLQHFLQHTNDEDIKKILQDALNLCINFMGEIVKLFEKENIPIPKGLKDEDVNLKAPRLFADEFYLHYLKYVAKAGLSLYSTAIPMMLRIDVRDFLINCNSYTIALLTQVNETLENKGFLTKPPVIPIPKRVDFVKKQSYLNGFFGDVRPLHALEIAHLYDNIENNATSKALIIGFSQVANMDHVRDFLHRGKEMTMKHIESCTQKLHKDDLPAHPLLDDLVEPSTISPFSDKLMVFHKIDMFSMKIRSYANAISLNGRRDLGAMYGKFFADIGRYVEDGANILIDEGWMESPPQAADRDQLASE
jgi:hypothetical protein